MFISLLRTYLRPYQRPITMIVLFQLVSTIASLYLPGLNALIIDEGVVKGDTGYIVRTCLLYTSPSPRDATLSRMPSSA